jgi:arylsulfatase A-like enzyme
LWNDDENFLIKENEGPNNGAYAPELIQKQTLDFIDNNKDQPFFLFVPSIMPHAELAAPESYMEKYRGKYGEEKTFEGATPETKNFKQGPYASQPEPHAAFAAMINVLDDQVGEIVTKLKSLGIYNNTVIIFTSDNGPHLEGGADPDFFDSNGPLRGYKRDVYEGGVRVPLIVHWPEKIKPGTTDHISAFWDFVPTFAELIGADAPSGIDGISMMPTLMGTPNQQQHEIMYWEFHEQGGKQAMRKDNWKIVKLNVNDSTKTTFELYNLENDLAETNNLASTYPDTLEMLKPLIENSHVRNPEFRFDWE